MSLVAFGIRIAAVRAIRAVIWPEFPVADSPASTIALLDEGKPLVAVYTAHANEGLEGNEVLSGDPKVSLTIQIYLPAEVTVTVAGAPLKFDTTKEGAETVLDVIAHRILAAFAAQAEPWSRMWASLVTRTARMQNHSYLVESTSVRTSAREITLECETLYDPIPGGPPEGLWADLVALMRTEDPASPHSVAHLADWLSAEIAGPQALPQEERDRIDLGLSAYAAGAVSILPIVRGSEIGEVAVTVDGTEGDQVVVPGPEASPAP